MKSTEPVRTFSEDIRSRSSAPQSSAVDLVRNAAENQQEIIKVTVGEQLIVLPPPAGVFRYDGKSAKVDRFGQELLGPRSRLLAAFGSEGNLADVEKDKFPNLERRFMACVDRKCEDETVTLQSFASLKEAMRNKEDKSAKLNKDILGEIEKRSTKALTEMLHNSVFFKYTKFVPLGCFDESPESLLMTVLEKTKMPATDANSSPVEMIEITSAAWVLVRQHLVQLFCGSQLKSVEDVEWTRTQLKTWRDAVVAANSSTR